MLARRIGHSNVLVTVPGRNLQLSFRLEANVPPEPWSSLRSLPKRFLYRLRSSASSINFLYLLVSLRSSGSRLHLLSRLPVHSVLNSDV
jgi:hypothetical protein